MMIECFVHGFYNAFELSPDLKKKIESSNNSGKIITVDYEYDGDVVETFYLSEGFAKEHGFKNSVKLMLPDDYPEWTKLLVPFCEKCFNESTDH